MKKIEFIKLLNQPPNKLGEEQLFDKQSLLQIFFFFFLLTK